MLYFVVFLIFLAILAPAFIGLNMRSIFGRKIGKNGKLVGCSLSVVGMVLMSLLLIYSHLYTESLWFHGLGYDAVFWKKVLTQGILFAVFGSLAFLFLRLNGFLLKKFLGLAVRKKASQKVFDLIANLISGFLAVIVGYLASNQWQKFLMFFNQVESGVADPIFQKDISFYLFSLPVQDYLSTLLFVLSFISCVVMGICYFVFLRPSGRKFSGAGSIILIGLLAAIVWKVSLAPYHLLSGGGDVFYGAGYADIHVKLLIYKAFLVISILGVAALIANAFLNSWKVVVPVLGVVIFTWMMAGVVPSVFWKIKVEPNQLEKEYEYIGYNIQCTRQAYGLDQIEEREFELDISFEALAQNQETLDNVRLWDARALLSGYHQRQAFRPYYRFSNIDVDRYMIDGSYRQVMLAPRELDREKLDKRSQTWVNERLKFTHGYGVVLNAVNEFGVGGVPNFLLGDIPPQSSVPEIEVTRPEIYYGLLTRDYVITNTTEPEFDYPQGDANIYTHYRGEGGVEMEGGLRKIALALKFNDKDILLSDHLKSESRLMFRRQIEERINTLAPFLKYDRDPYLVVDDQGSLWWIVDAYTTSSMYPYSEPCSGDGTNYIRNSVKVVVNAYDGQVSFYVFDESDPIIRTWMNIFPELFQSKDKMPQDLLSHIRYPETLLRLQAEMYCNYHMTDPQVFYNREDSWQFGSELYEARGGPSVFLPGEDGEDSFFGMPTRKIEDESLGQEALPQEMLPYFVIIRMPGNSENEFIQMLPFTPRDKDNLIGWIAGRSDGEHYGKALVFKFSKQMLVYGPMQFEVRINQNPEMKEKFALWNQPGSETIRGNTLIIPIENTLLYVEPIYLKATQQSEMPEIKKVIVAMGDKLEWGDSFEEAIGKIIGSGVSGNTVREVITSAQRYFNEYQKLTSEGKLQEAGQALEKLQKELQRIHELIDEMEEAED